MDIRRWQGGFAADVGLVLPDVELDGARSAGGTVAETGRAMPFWSDHAGEPAGQEVTERGVVHHGTAGGVDEGVV